MRMILGLLLLSTHGSILGSPSPTTTTAHKMKKKNGGICPMAAFLLPPPPTHTTTVALPFIVRRRQQEREEPRVRRRGGGYPPRVRGDCTLHLQSLQQRQQAQQQQQRAFRRWPGRQRLFSSSSSSISSSTARVGDARGRDNGGGGGSPPPPPVILYQKIVQPPPSMRTNDLEFLGSLVSFLQDHWQLPERLPMVYQSTIPPSHDNGEEDYEDDDDNKNDDIDLINYPSTHTTHTEATTRNTPMNSDPSVLILESPLSPSPVATTLKIEVVVIYPKSSSSPRTVATASTTTTMAMVVVKKDAQSKRVFAQVLPPMLQNLFQESERQIIKALDRELVDFSLSTTTRPTTTTTTSARSTPEQEALQQSNKATTTAAPVAESVTAEPDWEGELWGEEEPDDDDDVLLKNGKDDGEDAMARSSLPSPQTTSDGENHNNMNILDAEVVQSSTTMDDTSQQPQEQQQQQTVAQSLPSPPTTPTTNHKVPAKQAETPPPQGFAVQAAQRIAQQKKAEGFAVTAARRAAARIRQQQPSPIGRESELPVPTPKDVVQAADHSIDKNNNDVSNNDDTLNNNNQNQQEQQPPLGVGDEEVDLSTLRPASLRPENIGPRAFHRTVSLPGDFQKRMEERRRRRTANQSNSNARTQKPSYSSSAAATPLSSSQPEEETNAIASKLTNEKIMAASRDLDISVKENVSVAVHGKNETGNSAMDASKATADSVGVEAEKVPKAVNNTSKSEKNEEDSLEDKAIRSVTEALDEMVDNSSELTPEQLLQSVMKFGDEQQKEERKGSGFVSGALDKAKERLKEQHKQRQTMALQREQSSPEATRKAGTTTTELQQDTESSPIRPRSPEEELKEMFEAGERLADGRITNSLAKGKNGNHRSSSLTSSSAPRETTEEDVDALIASDKDVSDYARVLDDELVELEVKLNKAPGDDRAMDGTRPNYDIFSGPEAYNPNVDPETAVNWPGALPDTKNLKKKLDRLPKDLQEAVKQAEFAAGALLRLKEVTDEDGSSSSATKYYIGDKEITQEQVQKMRLVLSDAVAIGLIRDPLQLMAERSRLQLLVDELWNQPEERIKEITGNYKDVLLSDSFVQLIRERLSSMVERDLNALRQDEGGDDDDDNAMDQKGAREREILGQLVVQAQLLVKEARALGAELEAQQLEIIRSICKVAMDPMHKTEEETTMALTDAVRDMRPLFDDAFVAYLKYAVAEEEGRLARAGVLDDSEHNQWLWVLKIVQNGVYTELERGIQRYMDHIGYVLRMETAKERRMLLEKLIDVMPTLDVRPFVAVVDNLAGALGDGARGEFGGSNGSSSEEEAFLLGRMTNQIMQLYRDVHEMLPPERIAFKAKDADEWAARQKQILVERRQETQKRLQAARQTQDYDQAVDALGRQGEMERFDL